MEIGIFLLPFMVGFVLFKNLTAGVHLIDKNVEYNNSQPEFISPARWMKKLFKLKSLLLPKYICYHFYAVFLLLLNPACLVIYIVTKESPLVLFVMRAQIIYVVVDMIVSQIHWRFYKKQLEKRTKNIEKPSDEEQS